MNRIILVTGEINSGKTTFLKYFLENVVRKSGLNPGGFLAEGIFKTGQKSGFDLLGLRNFEKKLLCTDIPKKGWLNAGRYYFDPEGFRFGEMELSNLPENVCPVVIDEFGPLELKGQGWRPAIDNLLDMDDLILLISVRKEILARVIEYFSGHEIHVFDISRSTPESLAQEMAKLLPA